MRTKYKFKDTELSFKVQPTSYQAALDYIGECSIFDESRSVYGYYNSLTAPFMFSPKTSTKLYQIEERLGMTRFEIISILEEAGYSIPNKANYTLTFDQLSIISKAYEKSLKLLFKKYKKQTQNYDFNSIEENANYFRAFIEDSEWFNSYEIFNQELSSKLIENWVFNRVFATYSEELFDNSFSRLVRKLKFQLQKLYRDLRIQISSIILSHHYHVFPSEEDSSEKINSALSFSDSLFNWMRKAKIGFNLIIANKNDRYTEFNTTYKRMQFIRG
ncbi:MAG: hypothetical protein C0448_09705 [Sphingobacteriaceae bacterium]|nr:hypothetical protein [Sphingobacteriaceae bacterium]